MALGENCVKFNLLVWKNHTLQKRRHKKLVVEILIPFFIGAFLLYVRSAVEVTEIEIPTVYSPFETNFIPKFPSDNASLRADDCGTFPWGNGCEGNGGNFTDKPDRIASPNLRTLKFLRATAQNKSADRWIVLWSPQDDELEKVMNKACRNMNVTCYPAKDSYTLMRYMTQPSEFPYSKEAVLAGVVFPDNLNENKKLPLNLSVKIRFPAERRFPKDKLSKILPSTWLTSLTFPKFQTSGPRDKNLNEGGSPGYYSEGFLGVVDAVSSSLLQYHYGALNKDFIIRLKRFPYPKYVIDPMLIAMQNFLPFLIVISFLFSVNSLVERITTEKEKRLKIIMNIMGLSNTLRWASWFIYSLFFFSLLIIILIMSIKIPFINGVSVFPMSDWSCLAVFFLCYASAAVTFCFLMSTISSRAGSASITSGMIWFLTFIPFYSMQGKYIEVDTLVKLFLSLFLNTGMAIGFQIILMYEGAGSGIQWSNMATPVTPDDGMTMAHVLVILLFDSVLHMCMALYIEQVFPGEYGIPLPWHYPFHKTYWCGRKDKNDNRIEKMSGDDKGDSTFEEESNCLQGGIQIRNLTKIYKRSEKPAIDNLNLNICKNEITVLMGFNGAGKTTTLSILTGIYPATSGTVIIEGFDIRTHMKNVRKSIGFCPQHNILFDELTVEEHIRFFTQLKGFKGSELSAEVDFYINLLNLPDKRSTLAKHLSGGMKRKLSVALALCGNTKVIIFDEPTAGMDPKARRELWDLLISVKKDRTILLTTHFLDEADLLGDKVAIMSEGKLLCHGTTFSLKKQFSSGYRLSMVKEDNCETQKVYQLIKSHIPEIHKVQDIGMDLSFYLPEKYSSKFETLLDAIEKNKKSLQISSYGITPTTLEDIFMRIAEQTMSNNKSFFIKDESSINPNEDTKVNIYDYSKAGRNVRQFNKILAMFYKHAKSTLRSWKSYLLLIIIASFGVISAVIVLRSNRTDELDLPSLALDLKNFPDGIVLAKRGENCKSDCESVLRAFAQIAEKEKLDVLTLNHSIDMDQYLLKESEKNIYDYRTRYLLGSAFDMESQNIFVTGWFNAEPFHISPVALLFIYNSILKVLANASVSFTNEPLPYKEETKIAFQEVGLDNGFQISIFIGFSYIFVSSYFVIFYIQEKITNAKLLQFVAGVDSLTFWCVSFIWNLLMSFGPNASVLIMLLIFQEEGFKNADEIGYCALVLFVFFISLLPLIYFSSLFFSKPAVGFIILTFFNGITGIYTAILIMIFQVPILDLLDIANTLDWIFSIFPLYSMVLSLRNINLSSKRLKMCKEIYENFCLKKDDFIHICCKEPKKCPNENCIEWTESIWDWNQPGILRYITFLLATGAAFFIMVLIFESRIFQMLKIRKKPEEMNKTVDSDVYDEYEKVKSVPKNDREKFNLLIDGVSRSFRKVRAVNNIYLAVDKTECFGLLGTNGAGKTTTFKILTGDDYPTSGNVYVKGNSLRTKMKKVYKMIGYCPQFDALFDDLTGREHLYLYGLLRGIRKSNIDEVTTKLSQELLFSEFLDKKVVKYSGGNKRKLSTALALLGDPVILYLDEPTSGMDPVAKRHLWSVLSKVRSKGITVVLTSHSMEECEALCTRLAIMVKGEFKCLGSNQYLKTKFSQGYSLVIKMGKKGRRLDAGLDVESQDAANLEAIKKYVAKNFQGATLVESHQDLLAFRIPQSNITLSRMFGIIESVKENLNIEDYTLGQTTLEQILLALTDNRMNADRD